MAKRLREEESTPNGLNSSSLPEQANEGHTPKFAGLEEEVEVKGPATAERSSTTMQCIFPPHKPLTFKTYQDFESHYNASHTNRCRSCQKNFPSQHYLSLHISENHDPLLATRRDKGDKTYACFVEDCDKVCLEWKKRRSHLVDKHGFPKNFDFLVVDHGIDGRRSLLRPGVDREGHRKSSRERGRRDSSATTGTQTTEATEISQVTEDDVVEGEEDKLDATASNVRSPAKPKDAAVDDITKSMSSLQFVPRSIKFGRKGMSGFAKS